MTNNQLEKTFFCCCLFKVDINTFPTRDCRHVSAVPETAVGDLQFGDHGQAKEGHRDEGRLHRAAGLGSHVAEQPAAVCHLMAVER